TMVNLPEFDLLGTPRPQGLPDIGAYETAPLAPGPDPGPDPDPGTDPDPGPDPVLDPTDGLEADPWTAGVNALVLRGTSGDDPIVGGSGTDSLDGGAGCDLVIASALAYDSADPALKTLALTWSTGGPYARKTTSLSQSLLIAIQGDAEPDTLSGGPSTDWL